MAIRKCRADVLRPYHLSRKYRTLAPSAVSGALGSGPWRSTPIWPWPRPSRRWPGAFVPAGSSRLGPGPGWSGPTCALCAASTSSRARAAWSWSSAGKSPVSSRYWRAITSWSAKRPPSPGALRGRRPRPGVPQRDDTAHFLARRWGGSGPPRRRALRAPAGCPPVPRRSASLRSWPRQGSPARNAWATSQQECQCAAKHRPLLFWGAALSRRTRQEAFEAILDESGVPAQLDDLSPRQDSNLRPLD